MGSGWSLRIYNFLYSWGVGEGVRRHQYSLAAAVMPRDSSWRAGQAPSTPAPFRRWCSQVLFDRRGKQEVHGPILPWSIQVMPGLHKHLWWKCLSVSKVQWSILTPRVELGNLSLPLPFLTILQGQGCCPDAWSLWLVVPRACERFPRQSVKGLTNTGVKLSAMVP